VLVRNRGVVREALFEEFKAKDDTSKAIDAFKSRLIIAYEQAIADGVSPNAVLPAALDWLSVELKRCAGADYNGE
jgi:hypothetical protein